MNRPIGPAGGAVGSALDSRIDRSRRQGGRSLDPSARSSLEQGFATDLSAVRVHTGPEASALSSALNARAFTVGSDIFFSGSEYRPGTTAGLRLLAHETAHVVTEGGPIRRSVRTVIRRNYAGLSAPDKARVDALAERKYAEKAEEYEYKLGKYLETNAYSIQIADVLLDKVKLIVDAWAGKTGRSKEKAYEQEFAFAEGDKYYGAFEMTGKAIKAVFDDRSQPMRKKLKIVYNAVRNNNLPKWLKIAADDLNEAEAVARGDKRRAQGVKAARYTGASKDAQGHLLNPTEQITVKPGFAAKSGLGAVLTGDAGLRGRVEGASDREAASVGSGVNKRKVHLGAGDQWSGLARGTSVESGAVDEANRSRQYNQNQGTTIGEQLTLQRGDVPDLTSAEIRLLKQRAGQNPGKYTTGSEKRAFKAATTDKILWEQGREAIKVMDNSAVDRNARSIMARLEAGVSGSTNMMLVASKSLGVSDLASLQKLRLAMLGWMLPNHDHSFYEIMKAAEIQGVPFFVDATRPGIQYEDASNFVPEDVTKFKNLLPEKRYPRHFLGTYYKNKLAGAPLTAEKGPVPDAQTDVQDRRALRIDLKARGIHKPDRDALDDRSLVELQKLGKLVAAAIFHDEAVTDLDPAKQANLRAKAVARNRLQHRRLRDDAAYQYLVHEHPARTELWFTQLLRTAGKPMAPGGDLIRQGRAALPAVAADDEAGLRLQLQTGGVPALIVARLALHQLVDLVQIKAMAAGLGTAAPEAKVATVSKTPQWVRLGAGGMPHFDELLNEMLGLRALGNAAGIPASMMRSMSPFVLAALVDGVKTDVRRIAALLPAAQEAELANVGVTFANVKTVVDKLGPNRFDLVVAAMARVEGATLAGNTHFATLSKAAQVLGPETITGPTTQAESGLSNLALNMASAQVDANITAPDTRATFGLHNLLPHEIAAINKYTQYGGMGAWQGALSSLDTTGKMAADKLTKLAPTMRAAVSGLAKLPAFNQDCYGAQRMDLAGKPDLAMRLFKKGTVHSQDNFLSMGETIVDSFIPKAGYGVAWVILAGHRGKQVDKLSTNPGELEVLFAPGSRFIVDRDPDDRSAVPGPPGYGKVWVWLREIT